MFFETVVDFVFEVVSGMFFEAIAERRRPTYIYYLALRGQNRTGEETRGPSTTRQQKAKA
jgi:hypothetical protein